MMMRSFKSWMANSFLSASQFSVRKNIASQKSEGFTLIEVMVAIGILATLGIVCLNSANSSTRDIALMRDKIEALSIAEYALTNVLIYRDMPELGRDEEILDRGDRRWLIELNVSETLNERVRRVDVLVKPYESLGGEAERTTILLSGFRTDLEPD